MAKRVVVGSVPKRPNAGGELAARAGQVRGGRHRRGAEEPARAEQAARGAAAAHARRAALGRGGAVPQGRRGHGAVPADHVLLPRRRQPPARHRRRPLRGALRGRCEGRLSQSRFYYSCRCGYLA